MGCAKCHDNIYTLKEIKVPVNIKKYYEFLNARKMPKKSVVIKQKNKHIKKG